MYCHTDGLYSDPKPKGLGFMRNNDDKMIFEINCNKKLVEDEL